MIDKVENRFLVNWMYAILLILVIFSNVFYIDLQNTFYLYPKIIEEDFTQVHFIDVGQGDAIAIKFSNGQTMLIDSGTEQYKDKLLYYLDNIIVSNNTIDYLVLTHPDADHSSNMTTIIDKYHIGKFFRPNVYETSEGEEPLCENLIYRNLLEKLQDKNIPISFANRHVYMEIGNAKVDFLSPTQEMIENYSDTNNISPVIVVEENDTKLMLTGDIDSKIEETLIDIYDDELDIDLLKLAYHGSKYSTSYEFLEALTPKSIVVSVGVNTYGHPANDTIERILQYDEEYNTNLYDNFYSTKDSGNVIITLNENLLMQNIENIEKYIFVPYYLFTIVVSLIILFFLGKPYIKYLTKFMKFEIYNKNYKKNKQKRLIEEKTKKIEKI